MKLIIAVLLSVSTIHYSFTTGNKNLSHLNDNDKRDTINYKIIQLKKTHTFEDYKVDVYQGELTAPDFTNNPYANDEEYVKFITEGCNKTNINFGGHYTIIEQSCGAECSHIFIINRKNGYIFTDIRPNKGRYGYEYRKDSKLLIANSNLFVDNNYKKYITYWCKPEFYKWNKNNFVRMK